MAQFFFDIEQRGLVFRDHFGSALEGEHEVPDQATALLAEAVRHGLEAAPALLYGRAVFAVTARDEGGREVYRVSAAIEGASVRPRARLCGPGERP